MLRTLCPLLWLLAALHPANAAAASDPAAAYEAGVASARAGDFERALAHFESARDAGLDTPNLAYNLGVVNFRLARYEAARTAFLGLTLDPAWRALAHYNLGLVAETLEQQDRALAEFRTAFELADSEKLRVLAADKLQHAAATSSVPPPAPPAARWRGLVSLAGGYDDNVVLANDLFVADVTDQSDAFAEVLAAGTRRLSGNDERGWLADLSGYYRAHAELGDFDYGAFAAAAFWRMPLESWRLATGVRVETQLSGGERFADAATYRLQLDRGDADVRWRIRQDVSWLHGNDPYGYLSGWRARTLAQGSQLRPWGVIRGGLEMELNDRDDLATGEAFYSYSPTRYGVFAGVDVDLSERLRIDVRGDLQWSRYPDDNRYQDAATGLPVEAPRDEDTMALDVRLEFRATPQWQVWAQYRFLDSDSAIPRYVYTANTYLLGLETYF